jgi:antitoxin ParD1/3/4
MDLELDAELQRFVEDQVASGRYASAKAVVSASLALLVDFERERSALDAELGRRIEGLDRGDIVTADELRTHFRQRGEMLRARRHASAA